ncbi:hypothetical protein AK812_SmicGene4164 [Symbiodinium microadriaticum]|uniref:Uncharacterized protein n=1 Tax=Symbiodinium microadriaticum TaxID=2951 RepID=A0A1Q9EWY8_SYMMI|nr:hypothetical protein AK812_SmicGene4164 [Symbiodinium microadriaticum]
MFAVHIALILPGQTFFPFLFAGFRGESDGVRKPKQREALEPVPLPPDESGSQGPSPAVLAAKYRQHVRTMLAEFLELADNERV